MSILKPKRLSILFALGCWAFQVAYAQRVCNPKEFGAVADGKTKATVAIQNAIDRCAASGGGTVLLTGGKFLSAPIFLKSKITLQLDASATLLGSQDVEDYQRKPDQPNVGRTLLALVNAADANDIAITGKGVIDGAGERWWQEFKEAKVRPRLVYLSHCRGVRVEGITLKNSPSFHLVPAYSEDVTIENVTITAPADSPNTDGIDPSSSRQVRIVHCFIDVGDDNVAIKSDHPLPDHPEAAASDIEITGCEFVHGHGLSIGSGTNGGIRNVTATHIRFRDTDNGLRIKSPRGNAGEVSQITYSDISMEHVKNAIVISAYYPERTMAAPGQDAGQIVSATTPRFHHITIRNLTATGSKNAGRIVGVPESALHDIVLEQVSISAENGLLVRNATVDLTKVQIRAEKEPAFVIQEKANLNRH